MDDAVTRRYLSCKFVLWQLIAVDFLRTRWVQIWVEFSSLCGHYLQFARHHPRAVHAVRLMVHGQSAALLLPVVESHIHSVFGRARDRLHVWQPAGHGLLCSPRWRRRAVDGSICLLSSFVLFPRQKRQKK